MGLGYLLGFVFFISACAWVWGKTERQSFLSYAESPLKAEAPLLVCSTALRKLSCLPGSGKAVTAKQYEIHPDFLQKLPAGLPVEVLGTQLHEPAWLLNQKN